jgi:hypothetical protein
MAKNNTIGMVVINKKIFMILANWNTLASRLTPIIVKNPAISETQRRIRAASWGTRPKNRKGMANHEYKGLQ